MNFITKNKKTLTILIGLFVFVIVGLGVTYVFANPGPPGTPPACPSGSPGCDAPINVGSVMQTKSGVFEAGGLKATVLADPLNDSLIGGNSTLCANISGGVVICGVPYVGPSYSLPPNPTSSPNIFTTFEVGQSIPITSSTLTFNLSLGNKAVTAGTSKTTTIPGASLGSTSYTTGASSGTIPITIPLNTKMSTSSGSYSVSVSGGLNDQGGPVTGTATNSVSWSYRRYLLKIDGGALTNLKADIASGNKLTYSELTAYGALLDQTLGGAKQIDFSTTTSNNYIVYLFPSSLGVGINIFTSGCNTDTNVDFTSDQGIITFENQSTGTGSYYIYWSPQIYSGNVDMCLK